MHDDDDGDGGGVTETIEDRTPTEYAIGALIITYTILGVPYYKYTIMGPKTLF